MMASQVATAMVAADTMEASEHRACHDPLTGLPNRLQLESDLRAGLTAGASTVVAMADIDHFKRFNDEFGHSVGDMMLQMVASVLRHAVSDCDRVYRYGGEEFLLVFAGAGAAEAEVLAERVRVAIETTRLNGEKLEAAGPVTISIGLALVPDHRADVQQAIEVADAAMYRAKAKGGNASVLWTEDMPSRGLAA
jgi:diguanylate cyclase (GGDEF)-like protein